MRRADRLFQIVQYLRGGRLWTAAKLAEILEVSDRTIYRDIADLQSTGVPIDGEAGIGYILRSGYDIPPLMFTKDEIVAIVAGTRLIRAWGGVTMARAAEEALIKIEAVLPESERQRVANTQIHAPSFVMTDEQRQVIDQLQNAVDRRDILAISYKDLSGKDTQRQIRPLGLWFWGKVWTVIGWCELRQDFRAFRTDRIETLTPTGDKFRPERDKSLSEFYRQMEAQHLSP